MTHSLSLTSKASKLRRDPMALALRKTFAPVTEMTDALEAALKRLIVLDPDEPHGDDVFALSSSGAAAGLLWSMPPATGLQQHPELTR